LSQSISASRGTSPYTAPARQGLALARTRASKACQDMPARALTALWPRQYVARSSDVVLLCASYACVEHRLPALYTLDKRPGLPLLRRRRPHHLSAARPVTDIGCARAILSRFGRASYKLSIARTRASPSRPSLAPWIARSAAPWTLLHSTLGHLPPAINRAPQPSISSHTLLPSPH
jgi:hypothetical protein